MKKLIFVYNANAGLVSTTLDIAHKLISPSTYQCELCQLTHGVFKEREVWKQFRENNKEELIFYHKDEFEKRYQARFDYPVVLESDNDKLKIVLNSAQLAEIRDAADLIKAVQACKKASS